MIRKSTAIQWNRQNAILFHETNPLILEGREEKKLPRDTSAD
jgi:hypothetical protein